MAIYVMARMEYWLTLNIISYVKLTNFRKWGKMYIYTR